MKHVLIILAIEFVLRLLEGASSDKRAEIVSGLYDATKDRLPGPYQAAVQKHHWLDRVTNLFRKE